MPYIDEQVAELLGRMTLEEKIGQLTQVPAWKAYKKVNGRIEVSEEFQRILSDPGVGSVYGVLRADPWTGVTLEYGLNVREGAVAVNMIQRFAIENTRLGIPLLFGEECSHGHMAIGATVFPAPITVGCAWNPDLYRRMCAAVAAETRAQGGMVTYSPVLDIVRDPRWGRTEETFGEDPYLTSQMAVAAVKGLQGESLNTDHTIVATIKHFAAHGIPEGGHNCAPAHVGPRELREVYLKPFKEAIKVGALSVLSSYNEIDGVPCTGSSELLTEILREEWGFQGFVISDMGAVKRLHENHRVAPDSVHAGIMALEAGVDMEMRSLTHTEGGFSQVYLLTAVQKGLLSEKVIDRAVSRILRVKFLLGLFENPYVDPDRAERVVRCAKHRELARDIARQGIVLLNNSGRVLPLSSDLSSVAVIGPNADAMYNQLGDYTAPQPREYIVTVLDGIRSKVSPNTIVRYAKGCGIRDMSTEGFADAIDAAEKSEVAIVVVGGSSARDFGQDRYNVPTDATMVKPGWSIDS